MGGADMPALHKSLARKKDAETYARLTAPQHVRFSHFSKHEKIEGYFENRDVPEFMGSDRLLRLDTLYGTIQLGYNPRKGQSFLFSNIKTSVFDTAASRYQKELKEYQMMRGLKTGTQNTAYSAKRRANSAVILYKAETLPWSRRSVLPYLRRINMESLQKTMPFLDKTAEHNRREESLREHKALGRELSGKMAERNYTEMAAMRAGQRELLTEQNETAALIYRKDTQGRLFFRKINAALDIQKKEMFAWYRNRRQGGVMVEREPAVNDGKPPDEDRDD